jgi:hypothetical protein
MAQSFFVKILIQQYLDDSTLKGKYLVAGRYGMGYPSG